jgi:hypothetical protein
MGRNSQGDKDVLQGAAGAAAIFGGLSAVFFVVGGTLIALRLKALGFSSSILAASDLPRGYAFGIGLRTVISNAPFGVIAYVGITALTRLFTKWGIATTMFGRVWPRGRVVALALVVPLVLLLVGERWILLVFAVSAEASVWVAIRGARSSIGPRGSSSVWPRVILAVTITAAIAIGIEADRTAPVPFDQAVIVFRHGFGRHDVLGVQKAWWPVPLKPKYRAEVVPVPAGLDPLCAGERKPHICGLLLGVGGDGVTIASLTFAHDPRIVHVPHDEVATVFVVPTMTTIGPLQKADRRLPLYCRLPVLKGLGKLGGCSPYRRLPLYCRVPVLMPLRSLQGCGRRS